MHTAPPSPDQGEFQRTAGATRMVDPPGFEPGTSALSGRCSNQTELRTKDPDHKGMGGLPAPLDSNQRPPGFHSGALRTLS